MASEKSPLHSLRGAVARSGSMRVIACLRQQCRRVRFPRDDFARRGKDSGGNNGIAAGVRDNIRPRRNDNSHSDNCHVGTRNGGLVDCAVAAAILLRAAGCGECHRQTVGALVWWYRGPLVLVLLRSLHVAISADESCDASYCLRCRIDSSLHQENGLSFRPVISCSWSGGGLCSIQHCRYVVYANGAFCDEGYSGAPRDVLFISDYKRVARRF